MKARWLEERGVTLVELLAAMAAGVMVLTVVAGIQYAMARAWSRDTGLAGRQRSLQTALSTITDAVHSASSLSVDGGRLVVERPGRGRIAFYLDGTDLKAEQGTVTITLAGAISRFEADETEDGVAIRLSAGQGAETEQLETRADLPPWHREWGE